MKVSMDCVGCGQCAAYCPYDAIMVFGRAVMNDKCIECGTCIDYCPISAISGD
ncbi:MAG: 4Fe-4S binding protein [Candidatus Methanoperedens sp.]|nr:4Fe-4S binding protein [Candidatus Methanoperedens sp.]MCE8427874.1 4Fe-4S binding protein [Candidatus Methanoperedens sp.]